jgi:hypothetical protein
VFLAKQAQMDNAIPDLPKILDSPTDLEHIWQIPGPEEDEEQKKAADRVSVWALCYVWR